MNGTWYALWVQHYIIIIIIINQVISLLAFIVPKVMHVGSTAFMASPNHHGNLHGKHGANQMSLPTLIKVDGSSQIHPISLQHLERRAC